METHYGARYRILPANHFAEDQETFNFGGCQFLIKSGELEVGCESAEYSDQIGAIANQFIHAFNFNNGTKLSLDGYHKWQPKTNGGRLIELHLHDEVKVTGEISVSSVIQRGKANIVKKIYDSRDLSNQTVLVTKMQAIEPLRLALKYFSEEVAGEDRPLYGIYKALEVISREVGGWENSAKLAGKDRKFLKEITEPVQTTRHSEGYKNAKKTLAEDECRNRARIILDAYAKCLYPKGTF